MKSALVSRFTELALIAALVAPALAAVAVDWVVRRGRKHLADSSIDQSDPVG